ncbi:MAG: YeeE/YedE family protein [Bacillota bacterium]
MSIIPEKNTGLSFLIKNKSVFRQRQYALIIIFLNVVLLFLLSHYATRFFYPWLFGLLFGFVLQRSRFCFAAAFRDIFLIKNTILTRAVIVALIVSSLGFLLLEILNPGVELLFTFGKIQPVGLFTASGAFLFGIGMVIAGGCASGMLMRMGEGYMMQWVVMPGFLLGSAMGAWHLDWWYELFISRAPVVFIPHLLGWPLAVLLQISLLLALFILAGVYQNGWKGPASGWTKRINPLYLLQSHFPKSPGTGQGLYPLLFKKPWSYVTGGVLLALLNIFYFVAWGSPWGITDGITFFAAWMIEFIGFNPDKWFYFQGATRIEGCCLPATRINYWAFPLVYHFMAIITGALIASLLAGEFRLRKMRSPKFVFAALIGGLLMGYGARLSLGCNIGAFFSAIPSFSLHGWIFGVSVLAGSYLGGKILLRFLVGW